MPPTHDVTNQPPPLDGLDLYAADAALTDAVRVHGDSGIDESPLYALGRLAGRAETLDWGRLANDNPPVLRTHDRYGRRVDEVEFHPAWHQLMQTAIGHGLAGTPWAADPAGLPQLSRAAGLLVWGQVESGHLCPIVMTHAAVPALRVDPDVAAVWEPLLTSTAYEPTLRRADLKSGVIAGMGMTEKQGGSDVRSNTTRAEPGDEPGWYALTGHKWFCSAPMSDVFLVLAQAPGGLTCFLLPRVLPDGERNVFRIQRLKNKLGNRSNASAEIELEGTFARRLGEEGRGVRTIVEMVSATRLDCSLGSAAIMRRALVEAVHHTRHRSAFGARLVDQPLMRNVLADLAVESEAATALSLRLAAAVDRKEDALARIGVAVAKYWVCKRAILVTAEALECLGGNGYVEESGMPRHYREAPVNSVWEGSGNVVALDVLRAVRREPDSLDALLAEIGTARGEDPRYDAAVDDLLQSLADLGDVELRARRIVERMAVLLQGSLLLRHAPPMVADAFCATRVGGDGGHTVGTLPRGVDVAGIVDRALPG
jgi:putative acyl-CoA dehydrogenase